MLDVQFFINRSGCSLRGNLVFAYAHTNFDHNYVHCIFNSSEFPPSIRSIAHDMTEVSSELYELQKQIRDREERLKQERAEEDRWEAEKRKREEVKGCVSALLKVP